MARLIKKSLPPELYFRDSSPADRLPPKKVVRDLLSQLRHEELRNLYFQLGKHHLRDEEPMRAIQDLCYPFNFGSRVSRCGCYLKFDVEPHFIFKLPPG
jgi:hypothetical protein